MKNEKTMKGELNKVRRAVVLSMLLVLVVTTGKLDAQSSSDQFLSFRDFMSATTTAVSSDYLALPSSRVKDAGAFEQMRQHILSIYQGVEVKHSFFLNSQYFDCIPIDQQPAVRGPGAEGIKPPPPQSLLTDGALPDDAVPTDREPEVASQFDEFGNAAACEENTIPMLRLTLDELARFETLQKFFQKAPDGADDQTDQALAEPQRAEHRWAFADQKVDNRGGISDLSVWNPTVDTTKGQTFSLLQQWYAWGDRTNPDRPLQTVEGGWHVYPDFYRGDTNSRLFIAYSINNYGFWCYNLTCPVGRGFVQLSPTWRIGDTLPNNGVDYSVAGGAQHWFTMKWYLFGGDWWLCLKKQNSRYIQIVGYYPGELFGRGQLSSKAEKITFGGETASYIPLQGWGPMGSGALPNRNVGWGQAAYHSQILYYDMEFGSHPPNLTPKNWTPKCYAVYGPFQAPGTPWGTYFFVGGPGGTVDDCKN